MPQKAKIAARPRRAPDEWDAKTVQRRLLAWYDRHARALPWRETHDPYRVWISEMMLQQTQVETVIPYYRRFLKMFPDVFRLAAAELDQVLKLWEGLGYYSRARNLHAAAKRIAGAGGQWPATAAGWRELPGVGRYSAGAIASIAQGEPVPVLDGNVKRVLSRFFALRGGVDEPAVVAGLWRLAGDWVPRRRPGDFNQALMELGATVCRPRDWRCDVCPLRPACRAESRGLQAVIPVKRRRPKRPHHQVVAAVIEADGKILIGKRPPRGLLGGLWEFPGGKLETGESPAEGLAREIREELGTIIRVGKLIETVEHAYTHFSITLRAYACTLTGPAPEAREHSELKWAARGELERYAFPKADLAVLKKLSGK